MDVEHELKVHTLQVLLAVANAAEPINSTALIRSCGLDQRTVSRDTTQLGKRMIERDGAYVPSGLDLIEARPDLYETRQLAYTLTGKGKQFIEELNSL
jgi:DNA-binding MarR family transcriptional regulator